MNDLNMLLSCSGTTMSAWKVAAKVSCLVWKGYQNICSNLCCHDFVHLNCTNVYSLVRQVSKKVWLNIPWMFYWMFGQYYSCCAAQARKGNLPEDILQNLSNSLTILTVDMYLMTVVVTILVWSRPTLPAYRFFATVQLLPPRAPKFIAFSEEVILEQFAL